MNKKIIKIIVKIMPIKLTIDKSITLLKNYSLVLKNVSRLLKNFSLLLNDVTLFNNHIYIYIPNPDFPICKKLNAI